MKLKNSKWRSALAALGILIGANSAFGVTLTAYYDFEGMGDDRFDDPAGAFADNLTGQFNPAFSSDTAGAFVGSQSASFDGNSVLFTESFTTDLGPDLNSYSISFWVKGRDIDQENNNTRLMTTLIVPPNSNNTNPYWQVEGFGNSGGSSGDAMDVRIQNKPAGFSNWFSPDATNALARQDQNELVAEWHHVVFVLSNTGSPTDGGAFARTYVDGVQTGFADMGAEYDGFPIGNIAGEFIIGGHAENAGTRAFTGLLDDVALWSGVLTGEQVLALAQGRLSPADFLTTASSDVPEPATGALALLGLAALARRRRAARA